MIGIFVPLTVAHLLKFSKKKKIEGEFFAEILLIPLILNAEALKSTLILSKSGLNKLVT